MHYKQYFTKIAEIESQIVQKMLDEKRFIKGVRYLNVAMLVVSLVGAASFFYVDSLFGLLVLLVGVCVSLGVECGSFVLRSSKRISILEQTHYHLLEIKKAARGKADAGMLVSTEEVVGEMDALRVLEVSIKSKLMSV